MPDRDARGPSLDAPDYNFQNCPFSRKIRAFTSYTVPRAQYRSPQAHVHIPNDISIGSAVLAQLTLVTNRHTDHARTATTARILCYAQQRGITKINYEDSC